MGISKEISTFYNKDKVSKGGLYRLGVGAVIMKNGLIFCATRTSNVGNFTSTIQMPQGGIEEGEDVYQAVLREVFEETGIDKEHLIFEKRLSDWIYYDVPESFRPSINNKVGQCQIWYLFNFTGDDSDINLDSTGPEFSNFYWKSASYIVDNSIYFKKELHKSVFVSFDLLDAK